MKSLPLFLTTRYLSFQNKDKNIAHMVKICFLGIMIGTFSLMLTLIITNGFEKVIHEKMQGINSQIIVSSPGNRLTYQALSQLLLTEFKDNISAVSGRSLRQVILNKNNMQTVMLLQGVDGPNEIKVSTVALKITKPDKLTNYQKKDLLKNLEENEIIIGHKMATNFNIEIGETLTLMIPEPTSKKRILLEKQKFKVVGIFNIGLEEYDNNFAFCSLTTVNNLFNEQGVDQITLKLSEHDNNKLKNFLYNKLFQLNNEDVVLGKLKKRLPALQICSWKELYPALVSSLKLEKYVMFFILALITMVASMNMISLLFMQIQQKRRDIAILKALGMPTGQIRMIFLLIGIIITLLASTAGLCLAAVAGYLLETYPFIELPDVYYISYLPARMEINIFIIVFIVTMLLGLLAAWVPSKQTKQIKIAQILRQE